MRRRAFDGPRSFLRDLSGTSAVEFGIVSVFYLPILLGVVEVGLYVADRQDLMSAVHSAGRYAIVHGSHSSSPATAASLQSLVGSNLMLISSASVTSTASFSPNNNPGSTVTINASYLWKPLVPIVYFPNVSITASSVSTILH